MRSSPSTSTTRERHFSNCTNAFEDPIRLPQIVQHLCIIGSPRLQMIVQDNKTRNIVLCVEDNRMTRFFWEGGLAQSAFHAQQPSFISNGVRDSSLLLCGRGNFFQQGFSVFWKRIHLCALRSIHLRMGKLINGQWSRNTPLFRESSIDDETVNPRKNSTETSPG